MILTEIQSFLSQIMLSLDWDILFVVGVAFEILFAIFFLIKSRFSYEVRMVKFLGKINVWLSKNKFIDENNLVAFNEMMKKTPKQLRYYWHQYMLYRENEPSFYMSPYNCIEKPLKTSSFLANIKNLNVISYTFAILIAVLGFVSLTESFQFSTFAKALITPVIILVLNTIFVMLLRARENSNLSTFYQYFQYFNRFIDRAVTTMPEYVDFEILFTRQEIKSGIPVLNEYLEKRARQEQEELEKARMYAVEHEQYNFNDLGVDGSLVLDRAMKETETYLNIRQRLLSEIEQYESEIDSLKRNYENTQKDYQKKLQASKENILRLRKQQEESTNRIETNYIKKQQGDEIKKQEQLEKDHDTATVRFNQEMEALTKEIDTRRADLAERKQYVEDAMRAEYQTFSTKMYKSVNAIVEERVQDEKQMLIDVKDEVAIELQEANYIISERNNEIEDLRKLLHKHKISTKKIDAFYSNKLEQEARKVRRGRKDDENYVPLEERQQEENQETQIAEEQAVENQVLENKVEETKETQEVIAPAPEETNTIPVRPTPKSRPVAPAPVIQEPEVVEPEPQVQKQQDEPAEEEGYYDEAGNYIYANGAYYSPDGIYHDENGGWYEADGVTYHAPDEEQQESLAEEEGYYDEAGNYIYPNGAYYSPDGIYHDENGGWYEADGETYHPPVDETENNDEGDDEESVDAQEIVRPLSRKEAKQEEKIRKKLEKEEAKKMKEEEKLLKQLRKKEKALGIALDEQLQAEPEPIDPQIQEEIEDMGTVQSLDDFESQAAEEYVEPVYGPDVEEVIEPVPVYEEKSEQEEIEEDFDFGFDFTSPQEELAEEPLEEEISEEEVAIVEQPKRRGRPRKQQKTESEQEVVTEKKRGRPRKSEAKEEIMVSPKTEKRGRGRPKKTEEKQVKEEPVKKVGRPKGSTNKPKVGRPKGSTNKPKTVTAKRVGRPRKSELEEKTPVKRVGRPKKVEAAITPKTPMKKVGRPKKTDTDNETPVKKVGRPKGSTNKPKVGRPKGSTNKPKVGRPKGSTNKPKATKTTASRVGRPKKVEVEQKKGRGRPRKSDIDEMQKLNEQIENENKRLRERQRELRSQLDETLSILAEEEL